MSNRFITVLIASLVAAVGIAVFATSRSSNSTAADNPAPAAAPRPVPVANAEPNSDAYLGDYQTGFADGFNSGVTGQNFPEQASLPSKARGYLDGFTQGYSQGQSRQAELRDLICGTASAAPAADAYVDGGSYSRAAAGGSRRVLGSRDYNPSYAPARESNGIGSTTRKLLLIGGGTAAGAGIGGAIGGKKGAIIGALAGGGTGTVLALKNKPSRAFNRRVSGKSVLAKTAIGAGAGALIGGLTKGKKGAGIGAAIGGGGGALWSLFSGKRRTRR